MKNSICDHSAKTKNFDELLGELKALYIKKSNYASDNASTRDDKETPDESNYFTFNNETKKTKYNSLNQNNSKSNEHDIGKFFSLSDKYKSNDKIRKLEHTIKKKKVDLNLKREISEKLNKL